MRPSTLGIVAPHPPIMVPEVGRAEADATAHSAASMERAAQLLREFEPDTIIVMSPHAEGAYDAFGVEDSPRVAGDLGQFGAPQVRIDAAGDPELALAIIAESAAAGIPALPRSAFVRGGTLDHGVLVPMSFLQRSGATPLLVLSFAFLPLHTHREFGRAIARAANEMGRRVAFVASGDCSHRLFPGAPAGFSPEGRLYDRFLVESIGAGDWDAVEGVDIGRLETAGECGTRSFVTMAGFLDGTGAKTHLLSYEGPWGVGYLTAVASDPEVVAALPEPWVSEATAERGSRGGMPGTDASPQTRLARKAIEQYVRQGTRLDEFTGFEELLSERAGAFVSLHRQGELRGCIGCTGPTRADLAREIVDKAIEAAVNDPRFPPLEAQELDDLDISVDVLHDPEPMVSLTELDPKVYGVIVSCDWRRGLLLPDLEGVDTPEEQVAIAMRKAGIMPGETISLERFRVDRYF